MRHEVWFPSERHALAGHLYLPDDSPSGSTRSLPAVVVASPGSGIKEQTSGRYAEELSRLGFAALAFDHRGYGESEGYPRYDEDPIAKAEDIKNAISFLGRRPEIDPQRLAAMGICGGAGYVTYAAATDRRIKAVATVSGMTNNRASFEEMMGEDPSALAYVLDGTSAARQSFSEGNPPQYGVVIPEAGSANVIEPLKEAPSYYFDENRGAHPRWHNEVLAWSIEKQMTFNAVDMIAMIAPRPTLFVVGTVSGSRGQNEAAFEAAREPKELVLVDGASHIDLYDRDEYVEQVVGTLHRFFTANV
ncbi:hypothetical protein SAMN06295943_3178 [Agreia sp. VKM Ac-1783]|nr:hypothetical protein SAMN06295943_3178 [Agreia sp. VKM Ac-1783]